MRYDLILLTEARYESSSPTAASGYAQEIIREDLLVQEALTRKGLRTARFDWARPDVDWSSTRAALFRTTWDYFHRFEEFSAWLDKVSAQTRLINPIELIRWNMDKHYLQDLAGRGIHIPPVLFIHTGDHTTLEELCRPTGWPDMILKPAVSGSARHTYRLNPGNLSDYEATFQSLIAREDMMLQPFQHQVVEQGELSLMVIAGKYTHAVRKVAKPGEFRVQSDFGGTVRRHEPTREEIAFAERAVAACAPQPVYARVDLIRDNGGRLALMELELIEPEMWFRLYPSAAERLAEAVAGAL